MNSIADVPGIRVGHAQRVGSGWLTGTTVVLPGPAGAVAGVDVRGGGPGTRETDVLDPRNLVERAHAIVLTGGSAFGLAAADGVTRALLADGIGYPMGGPGEVVPIVPAAVIFDLGRGGVFGNAPDALLGAEAYAAAAQSDSVAEGCVGAGTGARAGGLKGGVGTASATLPDGTVVGALVVVNAVGSTLDPETGELYGARFCRPDDHLSLRLPGVLSPSPLVDLSAGRLASLSTARVAELSAARAAGQAAALAAGVPGAFAAPFATTLVVLATSATLTKAQCQKVSGIGHDGLARAINPVHTMVDGDTVFTLATGGSAAPSPEVFHALLDAAGSCVTRSVVRAMVAAESMGGMRSYREAFPSAFADS